MFLVVVHMASSPGRLTDSSRQGRVNIHTVVHNGEARLVALEIVVSMEFVRADYSLYLEMTT